MGLRTVACGVKSLRNGVRVLSHCIHGLYIAHLGKLMRNPCGVKCRNTHMEHKKQVLVTCVLKVSVVINAILAIY